MDKDKKTPAEDPDITYTVKGDTFAGGWATPTQSYGVSYDGGGTVDTVDIVDNVDTASIVYTVDTFDTFFSKKGSDSIE